MNLLHDLVPIRMLCPGVRPGVVCTGVGVMKPNGEYIFTSRLACLLLFLCDEPGVLLPAEPNGDLFVSRLCPRLGSFIFYNKSTVKPMHTVYKDSLMTTAIKQLFYYKNNRYFDRVYAESPMTIRK